MSHEQYLPYHRKYRPKTLQEYSGNAKLKKSMMAALRGTKQPQVLLFQGHAGCGKTSAARLVAREYLCENRDEIVGACGQCYNCQQLEEYIENGNSGSLMNVREIDVTDSNRKQDIDELLEDASVPAFDGGWKIFILDECHVMSNAAQNRLLKNLEEPAERVLMILCTTDPEKLLPTILSRCQYTFKVTKPSREELCELLVRVCRREGVKYDYKALSLVCAKGDFVPRKTLVALEQVVREKQEVTYENTVEVLDLVADKYFFTFYELLLADPINIFKYVAFVGEVKSAMDIRQFVDSLLSFTMRGLYISNGIIVEALDASEISKYKELFGKFRVGDIAYLLDLIVNMKSSLDVEAKLLLLGYKGLKAPKSTALAKENSESSDLIDTGGITSAQEKRHGDATFLESLVMTEDEKTDFVSEKTKLVTADYLSQRFQGTKIVPNK